MIVLYAEANHLTLRPEQQELSDTMRGLGANLSESEIEMVIKEVVQTTIKQDASLVQASRSIPLSFSLQVDLDGNGVISIHEFLHLMYS